MSRSQTWSGSRSSRSSVPWPARSASVAAVTVTSAAASPKRTAAAERPSGSRRTSRTRPIARTAVSRSAPKWPGPNRTKGRASPTGSTSGMLTWEDVKDPHVVIVGGGFAGLGAARALRAAPARVTLLDRRNHHVFQPLLYQVATAGLSAPEIAAPLRRILRHQANLTVLMGEVVSVDVGRRTLVLSDSEMGYDYLVLATGATHSYFGHDGWAAHAPGLKSI